MTARRRGVVFVSAIVLGLGGLVAPVSAGATAGPPSPAATAAPPRGAPSTALSHPGPRPTAPTPPKDTTPPSPVTDLTVSATTFGAITLSWHDPANVDLAGVTVRRRTGKVAPAGPKDGVLVARSGRTTMTVTDSGLTAGATYSYAVFARDRADNTSTPVSVTGQTLTRDNATGIAGRVTDAQGHPIGGVTVLFETAQSYAGTVLTGNDGRYAMTGLTAGPWIVCFSSAQPTSASPNGFLDECWDNTDPGFEGPPPNPTLVTVRPGHVTAHIDAALAPAGALTGRVLDRNAQPVTGVGVTAYGPRVDGFAITDATGRYTMRGISSTTARVCFSPGVTTQGPSTTGYLSACAPQQVTITPPGLTTVPTVTLARAGAVRGRVVGPTGKPLAGVQVLAYSPTYPNVGQTDANGSYAIVGLPAGPYAVCFDGTTVTTTGVPTGFVAECDGNRPYDPYGSADVPVVAGKAVRVDAQLSVGAGLRGRVTASNGQPIPGIGLIVRDNPAPQSFIQTDSDGRYSVTGVVPGSHVVCFDTGSGPYVSECFRNAPDEFGATPVLATAGKFTVANAVLSEGSSFTGTVTDKTGAPIPGVLVSAFTNGPAGPYGYATTDEAGRWSMTGLRADSYVISFDTSSVAVGAPTGYVSAYYHDQKPVVLRAGRTVTADVRLAVGGAIRGTVTGPDGQPVAGVYVSAGGPTPFGGGQTTAADGSYLLKGLAAGSWTVCFRPDPSLPGSELLVPQCFDDQPDTSPTLIPVASGATSVADARLAAGAGISGRITGARGEGVGSVQVAVYAGDGSYAAGATTDDTGAYGVGGLTAGDFTVCFDTSYATGSSSGGYVNECYDNQAPGGTPTTVTVQTGQVTGGIDAVLADGAGITGRVTAATGAPLGDISVSVITAGGNYRFTSTGADGTYAISGLSAGAVGVCFSSNPFDGSPGSVSRCYDDQPTGTPTPVDLVAGVVTSGIDAQLAPAAGVGGRVTDTAGVPTPATNVTVTSLADGTVLAVTSTLDDGTYQVIGLPPGAVSVCATSYNGSPQYSDRCYDAATPDSPTPVQLTAGTVTSGIDVVLIPLATAATPARRAPAAAEAH